MAPKIKSISSFILLLPLSLPIFQITSKSTDPAPVPAPWPPQFHAILFMNNSGALQKVDLWYDWPKGRNFNIIQSQLGKLTYDLEWDNGTSYIYTLDSNKECRILHFPVGILRPNWLDGAEYLGQKYVDGFLCNVWTKVDFIWYYEDVVTKRPVHWVFYTGYTADVITFEVVKSLQNCQVLTCWVPDMIDALKLLYIEQCIMMMSCEYMKSNIDDEEEAKIILMRALVEKQDPSSKEVDDLTLRRFLRARDSDIDKASAMLLKFLKWRQAFVQNGSISLSEVPGELAQNKMFLQGFDKKGRPVAVVLGARHFQNKLGGLEQFKRFVVYALDKICSRMPPGQEKFVVIGDLKGWGYANSDIRGYLGALSILQDYYPERLGKMFIVHAPYIFMTVWKIVYPFINNTTKKKIVFAEDKKLKSTLLEEMDESQIPEIYGGQLPLVPIQES